jgi:hypothetical protein
MDAKRKANGAFEEDERGAKRQKVPVGLQLLIAISLGWKRSYVVVFAISLRQDPQIAPYYGLVLEPLEP